jgi:thiamine phosphate synthase YjbQ (UPF0047 family)
VTSVEIPFSIAAALPALAVIDITNEVRHAVEDSGIDSGIVFVTSGEQPCIVRVNERESGFFEDLQELLERLIPLETGDRERLLCFLLGPRSEQVPFTDGRLCLGQWQRILVIGFDGNAHYGWQLTIVG